VQNRLASVNNVNKDTQEQSATTVNTSKRTARFRRTTPRPGVAAVECAIVAPLLVVLVLGSIDVGQYANVYQKISDASREGARYAARYETASESQVDTAVMNYLERVFPNVSPDTLAAATQITVTDDAGIPVSSGDMTSIPSGSQVVVEVTLQYNPVRWVSYLDFLTGSEITITTMMRRE